MVEVVETEEAEKAVAAAALLPNFEALIHTVVCLQNLLSIRRVIINQ